MISFTDTIDRGDRYYRFIAAWNWGIVLQVFVYLGIVAVVSSGTVPAAFAGLLGIAALFAVLIYQGFIALMTLNIRVPAASVIVLIDFVIALVLNHVTRSFYAG